MIALHAISYGNRVRAVRLAKGLSAATLAERAGITRQGLHKIEGGRMPKASTRAALAAALGCPEDELFYAEVAA